MQNHPVNTTRDILDALEQGPALAREMRRQLLGDQLEGFIAKADLLLKEWNDHRADMSAVATSISNLQRSVTRASREHGATGRKPPRRGLQPGK